MDENVEDVIMYASEALYILLREDYNGELDKSSVKHALCWSDSALRRAHDSLGRTC